MNQEEYLTKVQDSIVEVISLVISRLYHLPISELKIATPSLEDISRLCSLFNKLVVGTDIDGQFTEAIDVIGEAAVAASKDDESCLVDCAYQLEDFLGRIR